MTPKYDYVVCSIEEFNDLDILSIDELQSSLLMHEQRINRHTVDEQVLKVTHEIQRGGRGRRSGFKEDDERWVGIDLTSLPLNVTIVMNL
ncbi:hypothetical protein D8674_020108 [Pyrus ussuriensis x Pyrus communis]|uniref:Uncharacterized protein n=1 Tax=Pyrus ussuriensis x Pyrus communis TaxID=2448454 RepID=A0A5N5HLU4_9ROSA|nr:hypothetical protein D8674_020108 [Pyrus ussuriensis x Pyrus communis]